MAEEKSTVACIFYVSPVFNKTNENMGTRDTDEGPTSVWNVKWDKKDDFVNWLQENSLIPLRDMNIMNHNRRHYLFMGSNGVLCQMSSEKVAGDDVRDQFGAWEGTYRSVVLLKYQPLSKQIPPELKKQFDKREYVPGLKSLSDRVRKRVEAEFREEE